MNLQTTRAWHRYCLRESIAADEGHDRGIDMERYQQGIATRLEEAGVHFNIDEL